MRKPLFVVFALAALTGSAAAQSSLWNYSLVGVSNQSAPGEGISVIDGYWGAGESQTATTNSSFTGMDGSGNTQTMDFSGTTITSSQFGKLHSYTAGTLNNSYYNANNVSYQNGVGNPDNPAGSPDSLTALGFAGFTDTLQFGGALQTGYMARYIFHVDGINSALGAAADLGVKIGNDADEGFFDFNPGAIDTNWITVDHWIDGTNPTSIFVQFSTQAVFNTFELADGGNYTSSSDFSATLTLQEIMIVDANGNRVTGVTVNSASGAIYATPAPGAIVSMMAGLLPALRRRRRAGRN